MRLGHARGNGAHADFGHQLHADARIAIGVLEIVDQLGQVFDRIDVVVRRRRNQAHARGGVPRLGDPRIHLGAGQLAAFAGLGALRHLDLQFLRAHQVVGLVTPKRPEATCLMAEFFESPFSIGT